MGGKDRFCGTARPCFPILPDDPPDSEPPDPRGISPAGELECDRLRHRPPEQGAAVRTGQLNPCRARIRQGARALPLSQQRDIPVRQGSPAGRRARGEPLLADDEPFEDQGCDAGSLRFAKLTHFRTPECLLRSGSSLSRVPLIPGRMTFAGKQR